MALRIIFLLSFVRYIKFIICIQLHCRINVFKYLQLINIYTNIVYKKKLNIINN